MVVRQRTYWATVYKRTWKGSVVTSFVMPLLYVVAMGVLLGGFISTDANLEGAPSYLAFVAPGLVAAQAMQTATGEMTWPVMGGLKWHRTYFAMVGTPLAVADIVAAQLVFVMFRVATTSAVFLLVMAPFGVFESVLGVLLAWPVLVLLGLSFSGVFFAYSATIKNESSFAIIYRLLVIPMFLFSGAFFPISNLSAPAGVDRPPHTAVARRRPHPDARAGRRPAGAGAGAPGLPRGAQPRRLVARGLASRQSGGGVGTWPSSPLPPLAPSPRRRPPAGRSSGATSSSTRPAGWCS